MYFLWQLDKASGIILAWHNGKRTYADFRQLLQYLENIPIDLYYSDDWGSYARNLPEEKNVIEMRKVRISFDVWGKLDELSDFMVDKFKLPEEDAAIRRIDRLLDFIDYALCRFKRWRELGYRCAVFEKSLVFT